MDRMSSIEMALKNEKTEMEFYLSQAKHSRNPLAKAMFNNLAQDEEEHMNRIRNLHQRLISHGSWPENMPIEVAGTNIRTTLEKLVNTPNAAEKNNDDDIKALEKGMNFEARGAKFYADLSDVCTNPMEKSFFKFLSGIEREHHLSIIDSLEYLKDPQGWMMKHERSGLDGA